MRKVRQILENILLRGHRADFERLRSLVRNEVTHIRLLLTGNLRSRPLVPVNRAVLLLLIKGMVQFGHQVCVPFRRRGVLTEGRPVEADLFFAKTTDCLIRCLGTNV